MIVVTTMDFFQEQNNISTNDGHGAESSAYR
jgi:hypothetical protein